MADVFEVEKILGDRTRKGQTEYKIRWKKFGPKGDSWEPEEHLLDCTDALKEYKAQKSSRTAPTPRRSQRANPTPRTTTKPEPKVVKSTKKVKTTTVTVQKQKKTALENDFITPRPPRASIRQRVLELEESAQKTLQQIRNNQNQDEPDSVSFTRTPVSTQKARNRLMELKRWLDQDKSSGAEHEGASWWIVALCCLCFLAVVALIVWNSPASIS
ncbi:uncharacterized protein [Amphiura filiformis]|uniref:uncharacterized protein n=1 Tax=Amphiura filiformis TaxID=82378 RepID=UPI003B224C6C